MDVQISSEETRQETFWGRTFFLLAIASALLLFLPALRFGFLMDDHWLIEANPQLNSWHSAGGFFIHQAGVATPYYRPLFMLAMLVVAKSFGIHVWAFHAYTLLIYVLVICMAFLLLRRLGFTTLVSGWVCLLFAVHPVHIEVATWTSSGNESLMALPFLAALYCYLRFRQQPQPRFTWLFLSLFCYVLALLAKETAVIFPIVVLSTEMLVLAKRTKLQTALALLPFVVLTFCYLWMRRLAMGPHAIVSPVSWKMEFLTLPSMAFVYIHRFMDPRNVSIFYDNNYVTSFGSPNFIVPTAVLAAILLFVAFAIKRGWISRVEAFCVWMALVSAIPSLYFPALRWRELIHDRYLFLVSLFAAAILGSILTRLLRAGHIWRKAALVTLAALPVLFALECEAQVWFYRDEFTVFSHAYSIAPNNLSVMDTLVEELLQRGRVEEAKDMLHRETSLAPDWWFPRYKLGQIVAHDGDFAKAEELLTKAVASNPRPDLRIFLAQILEKEGKCDEAKKEWQLSGVSQQNTCIAHGSLDPSNSAR